MYQRRQDRHASTGRRRMKTAIDYDVIPLEEETTGWARRLLITHEDMSYHATLFWNSGDGFELIFRDISNPYWADDIDLALLDEQTWGGCCE
jgi:hypothetical protein